MAKPRSPQLDEHAPAAGQAATLARALAPEDVRAGDMVAVLHEVVEWPSWFWDADAALLPADQPVRIARTPSEAGIPLRVKAACLPFVLVEAPCGQRRTLDVRTSRLARLDRDYAAAARRAVKRALRKANKSKRAGKKSR